VSVKVLKHLLVRVLVQRPLHVRQGLVEYVLPTKIGQIKQLKKRVTVPLDDRTVITFLRRVFR